MPSNSTRPRKVSVWDFAWHDQFLYLSGSLALSWKLACQIHGGLDLVWVDCGYGVSGLRHLEQRVSM
jgi:hypothetical protein